MEINLSKNISTAMPKMGGPSRNSLVEGVLLIIVCALFTWFIIWPKKAEVAAKQDNLSQVLVTQQKLKTEVDSLSSMVQTLHSNPNDAAELDQALPLSANVPELEILINNLAQSVGLTIGDISIAGPTNPITSGDTALLADPYGATRTLQKLSGSVLVIGTFNQLQAFLQKIQTSGRLMDITDLEIDPASSNDLNLKLGLNAYYLAP